MTLILFHIQTSFFLTNPSHKLHISRAAEPFCWINNTLRLNSSFRGVFLHTVFFKQFSSCLKFSGLINDWNLSADGVFSILGDGSVLKVNSGTWVRFPVHVVSGLSPHKWSDPASLVSCEGSLPLYWCRVTHRFCTTPLQRVLSSLWTTTRPPRVEGVLESKADKG